MATLTGSTIASTYTGLLSVSGAVGADTVEAVTDGAGTSTSLSLSQQRATITLGSGAADDFIVDGTTLVVEGDNNRVGIGVAAPQSKVDIVDIYSASLSAQEALQLLIRGGEADLSPTGTSIGMGFGYGSENNYVKTGLVHEFIDAQGRGKLHLCTSNASGADTIAKGDARLTITETGNVGIGIQSPAHPLDVVGNIKASADILVNATNYALEGYSTGRNVIRSHSFLIEPGATPNTNIKVTRLGSGEFDWNIGASLTYHSGADDANSLGKNATLGSFLLSTSGSLMTINFAENVVGILSTSIAYQDLNSSTAPTYTVISAVSANNLIIKAYVEGNTTPVDWTSILDAGDSIAITFAFVTST